MMEHSEAFCAVQERWLGVWLGGPSGLGGHGVGRTVAITSAISSESGLECERAAGDPV